MVIHPREKNEIIGFIGAGRVGTALARQFHDRHFTISSIVDIDLDKALDCKRKSRARLGSRDIKDIDPETTVLFIAVPDQEVEGIAHALAERRHSKSGMVVAHTSGLLSSDALRSIPQDDACRCSMHPCYSFPENHVASLRGVYFALEGDLEGCMRLEKIVRAIGGKPFQLSKEEKTLYHAGCTMASNYLVALLDMVQSILKDIPSGENLYTVLPLIKGTIQNIEQRGVDKSLTGPILRGDIATVEKHLDELSKCNSHIIFPYIVLGRVTLAKALKLGLPPEKGDLLETIFHRYQGNTP